MDRPLVLLEPSILQICYFCENSIKQKEKRSKITTAGIDTIKICIEKWKIHKEISYKKFYLVWIQVKVTRVNPLKTTN